MATTTVHHETRRADLDPSINRDVLAKLAGMSPMLGKHGAGKYLGRVVLELWDPPDPTLNDGLLYLVAPTSLDPDELFGMVKAKLARRT